MTKRKRVKDQREKLAEFAALMAMGFDENQIILEMGLHHIEFEALLERFYREQEVRVAAKTSMRTYLDYANRQNQLIRDLEGLKNQLRGKEDEADDKRKWATGAGAGAYVGAVRAQSEIFDKVISTGQSLEIIKVAAKRIEHVGGRSVKDMNPEELRIAIQNELTAMQRMVNPKKSKHARKPVVLHSHPEPAPASEDAEV